MAQPNYANPLDHFRSHSYHFILTVANSTEAHRKMLDKGFLSSINSTMLGDRVKIEGEKAYLLVDTRRFSQFSITDFEMSQAYGTGSTDNPSVPVSGIKVKLVDTTGLTFFNFLMHTLRNRIQSTKGSAFYMLSILFVGHTDTGTTETISTCHIPMVMASMGFEYSSSGSTYDMEFFEVEGNPGTAIPQLVDLSDIQAISTEGRPNTVGGMLQALEDRLNLNSVRFFHKYSNEANKKSRDTRNTYAQAGKLVQYMITAPKEWEEFPLNTAGKSENVEQYFIAKTKAVQDQLKAASDAAAKTAAAQKARDSYASFSYSTSVQDAIKVILESSKQYLDLASTQKMREGKAIAPKVVVNITSDATTYLVHYDIYEYKAPKMDIENGQVKTSPFLQMPDGRVRNLLVYDYIHSGRSSHILDLKVEFSPYAAAAALDVDINLGQGRFADNAEAGQKIKLVDQASVDGEETSTHFNPLMRPGEPVFPPVKTRDQQTHFSSLNTEEMNRQEAHRNLKAKQEHTNTMAVLHFLGSLQAQMTIRGNPNLLKKYCDRQYRGGIPRHVLSMKVDDLKDLTADSADAFFTNNVKGKVKSGKDEYYKTFVLPRIDKAGSTGDEILDGPDIATYPLFAQINIFAPNVDFLGNTIPGNPQFPNRFFYNGAYQVPIITHLFSNGMFTQVMTLIPWDINGGFSTSTQATNAGSKPQLN